MTCNAKLYHDIFREGLVLTSQGFGVKEYFLDMQHKA